MSAGKYTMLIQQSTLHPTNNAIIRVGGWSESWYEYDTSFIASFLNLCERRAALLPNNAAIVGQRVQQVDPAGSAQVFGQVFTGTAGVQPDIPQMALLARARAVGVSNTRAVILRGIPDAYVENGEYVPSQGYAAKVLQFVGSLVNGGWKFRGRNLAADTSAILIVSPVLDSPTSDAIISLIGTVPSSFAVGNVVQVLGAVDFDGIKRGGSFKVKAVDTDERTITISHWPYESCESGRVRAITYIYPVVADVQPNRIITRKVGRPFTSYRGRRSKRRRVRTA